MDRLTKIDELRRAELVCCAECGIESGIYNHNCRYCEKSNAANEKLAAYEDAEEQGRLIMLPCKVGDTVYRLEEYTARCYGDDIYSCTYPTERCSHRTGQYCQKRSGKVVTSGNFNVSTDFDLKSMGLKSTVFLTREEAEKALRGEEKK